MNSQKAAGQLLLAGLSVGLLLCAGTRGVGEPVQATTPEQIFRAWQARQDRIQSARFTIQESLTVVAGTQPGRETSFQRHLIEVKSKPGKQRTPAHDTIVELKRGLSFDGGRMRYTIEGPQWVPAVEAFQKRLYLSVFDESTEKSFFGSTDDVFPLGFTNSERKGNADAETCYLHAIFMHYRPFHPTLGRFKPNGWTVAAVGGVVQGKPCLILEKVEGNWKDSCWVDPEQDFAILRYTTHARVSGKDTFRLDISYRRDQQHGPVPVEWNAVSLDVSTSAVQESFTATVPEYAVNVGMEPAEFQFEFPPDTLVRSSQEKLMYIQRANGSKRPITSEELLRAAKYKDLLATESGMAALRPSRGRMALYWLLAVSGVMIAVVYLWKRRKNQPAAKPS